MSDIVKRLRAPAYWISGSSEGHEGDNSAPAESAARIEQLEAALRDIQKFSLELYATGVARAALEERT